MTSKTPKEVTCLFCGRVIAKPENTLTDFGEVIYGRCSCLAVYVCDPTGHNVGEAYSEGLALLQGNWDLANALQHDYKDIDYDWRSHSIIYNKSLYQHSGKLVFLRHKDTSMVNPTTDKPKQPPKAAELKKAIRQSLANEDYDTITAFGLVDKAVIRQLISMSYDKEDVLCYRSIKALGLLCKALSLTQINVVRETIRKLLWSMGDESGGIGWSAPEMIAEIVRYEPHKYDDIIPVLWSYKEEAMFRAGVVLGLLRIALVDRERASFVLADLDELLKDQNPSVRAYTALLCKILGKSVDLDLAKDKEILIVYINGELRRLTVAEVVELSPEVLG